MKNGGEIEIPPVTSYIKGKENQWLGHMIRRGKDESCKVVMEWKPEETTSPTAKEVVICSKKRSKNLWSYKNGTKYFEVKGCRVGGENFLRVINAKRRIKILFFICKLQRFITVLKCQ